jgi:hypothetical protein
VREEHVIGATQPSTTDSTFSIAQNALGTSALPDVASPMIPSGATLRPRLKLGVGHAPSLKTRQLWEGTVTDVGKGGFIAVLSDRTDRNNPDEQATFEFDKTEISPDDELLLKPGASFYWIIGNEQTVAGQVKNVSMIQFRRVPAWTDHALEIAAKRARLLRESFQEEP